MNAAGTMIVLAKRKADQGVDYSPKHGALCPMCGEKARIYSTKPWDGPVRVRFHRCDNQACALASMRISIKSLEEDRVATP